MTSDNIERGVRGETAVLNCLVQKGFEVLIPWGGRKRYDIAYFVTDEHRNFGFFVHHESYLVRIQVKIGRLALDESGIDFNTKGIHGASIGSSKEWAYDSETDTAKNGAERRVSLRERL